jgi:hypothetical protein
MHEAGIAALIVERLRGWGSRAGRARVLVRGGHSDIEAFDAALRIHLLAADPDLDASRVEVVHLARTLTCASCGLRYDAKDATGVCPACGGAAWPDNAPEEVELELLGPTPPEVRSEGHNPCA